MIDDPDKSKPNQGESGGQNESPLFPTQLITAELLRTSIIKAQESQTGTTIVLYGMPGTGKSHIMDAVKVGLEDSGVVFLGDDDNMDGLGEGVIVVMSESTPRLRRAPKNAEVINHRGFTISEISQMISPDIRSEFSMDLALQSLGSVTILKSLESALLSTGQNSDNALVTLYDSLGDFLYLYFNLGQKGRVTPIDKYQKWLMENTHQDYYEVTSRLRGLMELNYKDSYLYDKYYLVLLDKIHKHQGLDFSLKAEGAIDAIKLFAKEGPKTDSEPRLKFIANIPKAFKNGMREANGLLGRTLAATNHYTRKTGLGVYGNSEARDWGTRDKCKIGNMPLEGLFEEGSLGSYGMDPLIDALPEKDDYDRLMGISGDHSYVMPENVRFIISLMTLCEQNGWEYVVDFEGRTYRYDPDADSMKEIQLPDSKF